MRENTQKQKRDTSQIQIDNGSAFVVSWEYGRHYKVNLTKEAC
ncbi:MAG: hypothetical protein Q8R36_04250 [bacterium]|nr:hypothetical protein [bacterium]